MGGKRFCEHCGEELIEGEGTTISGDLLCDECVEELCVICEHCSEVIYTDDSITDDYTWLCQDCYESYYRRCESCNRIIHDDDVNWHMDLPYCDICYSVYAQIKESGYLLERFPKYLFETFFDVISDISKEKFLKEH